MEYKATARYIRTSPRKLRLVASAVRHLPVKQALVFLSTMPNRAAQPLLHVIASAVASAKQKEIREDHLQFKTVEVLEGPKMKRWRAVARGQAHPFKKRMSHIRIVLTDEKKEKGSS